MRREREREKGARAGPVCKLDEAQDQTQTNPKANLQKELANIKQFLQWSVVQLSSEVATCIQCCLAFVGGLHGQVVVLRP